MLNKENLDSIMSIEDIRLSLPARLSEILDMNGADLPTWEAASFIVENKKWGEFVVLNTDYDSGLRQGKYVQILGENMFKINSFARDEYVKREKI